MSAGSSGNIKVVLRFRPQNKREIAEGGVPIVSYEPSGDIVKFDGDEFKGSFTFDRVFSPDQSQQFLFEEAVKPIVDEVLKGYNGTVFAYGQTGSGKTFTMMGADIDNHQQKGVIPRITEQIFANILESPSNLEFTVKVAYLEIYMEKIKDLLCPSSDNLPVHEEKSRGVYVKGLLEVYVSSVAEVYEVLHRGQASRAVAFTNMNAESSRSHSMFIITVNQKDVNAGGTSRSGRLYLVDLAGSEKVGKTGASGQTLEEAKKINKSLTALGMVINSLTDGKSTHVPYRDSKLTRILQESLGGNSRTTLIINASPSSFNEAETLSTLRFGMRAKSIKNKAKINAELSAVEMKMMIKKADALIVTYKEYVTLLEGEIKSWRRGDPVPVDKQVHLDMLNTRSNPQRPSSSAANSVVSVDSSIADSAVARSDGMPSSVPSLRAAGLSEDEHEDFFKRENELMDELSKRESDLEHEKQRVKQLSTDLELLKTHEADIFKENKELTETLHSLKMQLEKLTFTSAESEISMESVKEKNRILQAELELLRNQIDTLNAEHRAADEQSREKQKADKLAVLMAGIDPSMSEKERNIRASLTEFLQEGTTDDRTGETGSSEIDLALKVGSKDQTGELNEVLSRLETANGQLKLVSLENESLVRKRSEMETRIATLEVEYEQLLDRTIAAEEGREGVEPGAMSLKETLKTQFESKQGQYVSEIERLRDEVSQRNAQVAHLQASKESIELQCQDMQAKLQASQQEYKLLKSKLQSMDKPDSEKDKDLDRIKKSMADQIREFDVMKKSLMRDLQDRCEKVVELELSLDEIKQQYNTMIKNNQVKQTQSKMSMLERNLDQLTLVQKQLVDQNTNMKREILVNEKKLGARNERIQTLEEMLEETQSKLTAQKVAFENQILDIQHNRVSPATVTAEWGLTGRVAKPVRGTGPEQQGSDKRSSWLGGLMGGMR